MARRLQQCLRTAEASTKPQQTAQRFALVSGKEAVECLVFIRPTVSGFCVRGSEYVFDVLDCRFDVLDNPLYDLWDAPRFRKTLTLIRGFVTWV
jgi:hypothetical protein